MPGACRGSEELLTVLTAGAQAWSAGSRARPSCSPHQGALAAAWPISATSPPWERGMQGTGNRERAAPFYAACNSRHQGKVFTFMKVDPAFSEATLLPLWFAKN